MKKLNKALVAALLLALLSPAFQPGQANAQAAVNQNARASFDQLANNVWGFLNEYLLPILTGGNQKFPVPKPEPKPDPTPVPTPAPDSGNGKGQNNGGGKGNGNGNGQDKGNNGNNGQGNNGNGQGNNGNGQGNNGNGQGNNGNGQGNNGNGGKDHDDRYDSINKETIRKLNALKAACQRDLVSYAMQFAQATTTHQKSTLYKEASERFAQCVSDFKDIVSSAQNTLQNEGFSTDIIQEYQREYDIQMETGRMLLDNIVK
ncbi:hypothetical protein YDYSY3_14180 [Paenibacillus chitinolyticus]|uniref:hypothetical protein n=1 Tax=Paenibacillus chitinolyticus TaxID=79263 RepID=UPI0026E4BB93|nr:hypothetical protein [Paenibacillus chitinolyticus]GKS10418.1 hypothetical protein YDYSY3_14180 [Paenibacillus chitinolyticus]